MRIPRYGFLLALLCLSFGASTPAGAETSSLQLVSPSQVNWTAGDPSGGPEAAAREAAGWAAGETARRAARNAPVIWASFMLPNGPWRAPALLVEGASGDVQLWIDGKQSTATDGSVNDEVADLRSIPVPVTALGKRVELRMVGGNFQAALSRVSVGDEARVSEEIVRRGISASFLGLLMIVISLAALAAWALARRERFTLRVFALCAVSGLMVFGLAPASVLFVGTSFQLVCVFFGVGLFPWTLMALARDGFPALTHPFSVWVERLSLAWGVFFIASQVIGGVELATSLSPLPFLLATATSLFIAMKAARAGHPDGRVLLGALFVFFGVTVYDALPRFGLRDPSGFHIDIALLAMTGALVAIFARRMAHSAESIRLQSTALEAREKEGRAVTERLLADANELLAAVAQLRDSGSSQNETIEKQASALQETQVTAEEIRRTSTLAAEKAHALLQQAAKADETQRAGEQAVEESLVGLESIGSEVASMANAMGDVDQLAREIGGIVDVVKELADQSNMLALNAAIEAVRSGEHGKGFAVVAREVRRLADQSLQSTARIREVLERLAGGVRESTAAGERGEKSVALALERLRGSGEQMRSMSNILRETNASVRQISAAVTQQNAGISQIFTAVQHLSDQMKEAVLRVQEAESATVVVESVASRMSANRRSA